MKILVLILILGLGQLFIPFGFAAEGPAVDNKSCQLEPNQKYDQQLIIPESKLMTHVYLTVDTEIGVRSVQ